MLPHSQPHVPTVKHYPTIIRKAILEGYMLSCDIIKTAKAIVDGSDEEIQWPDANRRQELATIYPGIFKGCVGIADVKEFQVVKYKDTDKERRSWSGKKNKQLYK
jgi:hypothetical protein